MLHGLFSSCREWGLLFVAVLGLLIVVASLTTEPRLWGTWASVAGLQSTDRVVVVRGLSYSVGMWDLPRSGIEPISPVLVGGFFTTEPLGKP